MKSKIFLTSMLAVMVAFPASATTLGGNGETSPYNANCQGDPIDNVSAPGSTVTYTAQWAADECEITLDPNVANGGASASNPATLYTKFDFGAYLDSARTNLMSSATNGLFAPPTGATVTTTYNTNAPTNPSTGAPYVLTTAAPASTTPTRAFNGFFNAATGGTKYISEASPYYILGDTNTVGTGAYVAADIAKNDGVCPTTTWYAQWGCATRAIAADYAGTLTGYTTDGKWYTEPTAGTVESNTCTSTDQTLYLHWTPKKYTVTYDCGEGETDSVDTLGAEYDSSYNFRPLDCSLTGNIQSGWNCVTNTGGVAISMTDNATAWQVDDNVTCTAVYGANQITLEWYVDDVEVTDTLNNSDTCNYGDVNGITVNDPTKRGYSFAGWEVVGTNGQ